MAAFWITKSGVGELQRWKDNELVYDNATTEKKYIFLKTVSRLFQKHYEMSKVSQSEA